jgi:hypothetical protein
LGWVGIFGSGLGLLGLVWIKISWDLTVPTKLKVFFPVKNVWLQNNLCNVKLISFSRNNSTCRSTLSFAFEFNKKKTKETKKKLRIYLVSQKQTIKAQKVLSILKTI